MKTLLPRIDRNVEMRPRADNKFEKWDLERILSKNFVDRDHHFHRLMLKKNINR